MRSVSSFALIAAGRSTFSAVGLLMSGAGTATCERETVYDNTRWGVDGARAGLIADVGLGAAITTCVAGAIAGGGGGACSRAGCAGVVEQAGPFVARSLVSLPHLSRMTDGSRGLSFDISRP